MMISLFPTLLLCHLLTTVLSAGCPSTCNCKWRNGKQTVECVDKSLLIIPKGLDPATQVLDVSGNNFRFLQREKFLKVGLINLQKIFLSRCGIKSVQDGALKGLTNLVELDLSGNMLETVPTEALLDCPSLMKLSLGRNPIKSLERLAFNHLSFLNSLDLRSCKISMVNNDAFVGLYSLEWLDLSQNNVKSLENIRIFPNTLKGIQLHDNPWKCDCNIAPLNSWVKRELVSILIPPTCQEPKRYKDLPIRSLNPDELACIPEVSPTSFYFEMDERENITLLCQVKSLPPAKILWRFNGQILQNNTDVSPGLRLVYYLEENGQEQESGLLIYNLNSEHNGTFYCTAENPAGISYGNYTIMVILKKTPLKLDDKSDFPIELVAVVLAVGLIFLSLCFVVLIMSLIRCHSESKRKKRQSEVKNNFLSETATNVPEKTNFKGTDVANKFKTSGSKREISAPSRYPYQKQNPDIIKEIKNDTRYSLSNKVHYYPRTDNIPSVNPLSVVSDFTLTSHQLIRDSTQPYLKPTLTSSFRPISAPSFERYVESQDVRYTVDGYPERHRANAQWSNARHHKSVSTTPSHSGSFAPKYVSRVQPNEDRAEKLKQFIDGRKQTDNRVITVMDKDDVQL